MIGGLGTLGRWFIDRGMRKGTPMELRDHVITVYRGAGADELKTLLASLAGQAGR
jgi:hypothetical protein